MKVVNTFSSIILQDYSLIDNFEQKCLFNTYHWTCLNYVGLVEHAYSVSSTQEQSTALILPILKRSLPGEPSSKAQKVKPANSALRHFLKFPCAVKELSLLLKQRGIWEQNLDQVFTYLVKCKVERVCIFYPKFKQTSIIYRQ
jgi:hypothetical protein